MTLFAEALIGQSCSYFGKHNSLIFIIDILTVCNLLILVIEGLKGNECTALKVFTALKRENDIDSPLGCACRKRNFSRNWAAIRSQKCAVGGFVHQSGYKFIVRTTAREQALISNCINNCLRSASKKVLLPVLSGKGGMNIGNIDGLILILQIGMAAYKISVVTHFFKSNHRGTSEILAIKDEREFHTAGS